MIPDEMNEKDDVCRVVTTALGAGICHVARYSGWIEVTVRYLPDYWHINPEKTTVEGRYTINVGKKRMAQIVAAIEAAEARGAK